LRSSHDGTPGGFKKSAEMFEVIMLISIFLFFNQCFDNYAG